MPPLFCNSSIPNRPIIVPVGELATINLPVKAVYLGYSEVTPIDQVVRSAADLGYNLIILAFWIDPQTGVDPYSAAYWWSLLDDNTQKSVIEYVHGLGAAVIVSAGGSSYISYPQDGANTYGTQAATFALANYLDGVDFDMENFQTGFTTPSGLTKSQTIAWLTDAMTAARNIIGVDGIITTAPQSPYFNIEFDYGYLDFYLQDPTPPVDLYLIQYYNQGSTYLDYTTQFINDDNYHPGTAVAQLITAGMSRDKIVVGKLMQASDGQAASWVDPTTIHDWVTTAITDPQVEYWNTGIMTWQWHTTGTPNAATWIDTIY